MAKEKGQEDMWLLSFDLQTAKFTYTLVHITIFSFTQLIVTLYIGPHALGALHLVQAPTPHGVGNSLLYG